jgi:hypothetical protein
MTRRAISSWPWDGAWLDVSPAPGAKRDSAGHIAVPSVGPMTARLVVDCMGFGSPIVRQARHGQKPDGVCLVVGRGLHSTTFQLNISRFGHTSPCPPV